IPLVLTGEIYATAAFVASAAFIGSSYIGVPRDLSLGIAVVAGFAVRAAAIRYNLSLPAFMSEDR
ncbi:MAG: trimeric intracellular cation channel family protein, partial [Woeseiaceae bacterium]|nr:trimeric intracellular cation channel family protein [Woeseiaceae bacterium]